MKKNRISKDCLVCGNEFFTHPCKIRVGKGKYCSKQCNGKMRAIQVQEYNRKHPIKHTEERKQREREQWQGDKNPSWKGGVTYFKKKGNYKNIKYVRCPKPFLAMARKDGYVMEHRLLMAQKLQRPLLRAEVVHHVNHNPQDNRIENLQLFDSNKAHKIAESARSAVA